jgi:hypothetical protein
MKPYFRRHHKMVSHFLFFSFHHLCQVEPARTGLSLMYLLYCYSITSLKNTTIKSPLQALSETSAQFLSRLVSMSRRNRSQIRTTTYVFIGMCMRVLLLVMTCIYFSRIERVKALTHPRRQSMRLFATQKNNKQRMTPRGFGMPTTTSSVPAFKNVNLDTSTETRHFLTQVVDVNNNLKRTSLAYFDNNNNTSLRGIVALKDLKKGDDLIHIPYQRAINFGPQGADPTLAAVQLLTLYCSSYNQQDDAYYSYHQLLPEFKGTDCMGCTDFFSDAALDALQSPLIVEETLDRRKQTRQRFEASSSLQDLLWTDGSSVTVEHLQWAVWLITSRVLTVQGGANDDTDGQGKAYRLYVSILFIPVLMH